MADKELKSFKIGDTQRPSVGSSGPAQGQEIVEATSVGFARIEQLLDSESPESVATQLTELLSTLESFQENASSNKDKAASKKAIAAVARSADLMDYLFQTKASLESNV